MNRQLKFREWLGKEFHYWGFMEDGSFILPTNIKGPQQQMTGLLDKNRKEIWEGDVLHSFSGKYLVSFNNGCFSVVDKGLHFSLFTCPKEEIEVIGNIYKNPDLLK